MKMRIYNPTKTVMQSGKGNTKKWVAEFEQESRSAATPLIGWIGSSDMKQEIKLSFSTKEAAIAYAKEAGIEYEVIEPKKPKIIIQAYADNFK